MDANVRRLREKFPELIEFLVMTLALDDIVTGDMEPTVPPRADDGTLDPVAYVERGEYVECSHCGVKGFEDWDFIDKGGKPYCESCVKGR